MNSGSTNDCLAWDLSSAHSVVEDPNWPSDFYVIGDEAFVCTNNFLTPYSGRGLGPWKDAFNFYLSSMRQCVERSFALLVQRWGILWRPLQFNFSCWTKVLMALAKLHNFCIDENDIPIRQRFHEDILEGDQFDVITNEVILDEDAQRFLTTCRTGHRRRNNFRALLEEKGLRRPNYNINSRA
jgi:hypothetical protein